MLSVFKNGNAILMILVYLVCRLLPSVNTNLRPLFATSCLLNSVAFYSHNIITASTSFMLGSFDTFFHFYQK
jgi:hypothetical protein